MLIDTHAHLNFASFKDDFDKIIRECLNQHIWLINVGTKYTTSKRAVEIAQRYREGVFAAIGLHPIHLESRRVDPSELDFQKGFTSDKEDFDCQKYRELARSEKVVAIGEIGLDYYWKPKTKTRFEKFRKKQMEVLFEQVGLAKELDLPVIFHCRMAHSDLIEFLRSQVSGLGIRGVVHCFTGTWGQAQEYLEMGLYLGFNGIIFKKIDGVDFDEIIKKIPLERILVETDCPYLTPPDFPEKRNNPLGVSLICRHLAEIKGVSFEKMAIITTENAKELFKLAKPMDRIQDSEQ